MRGLVDMSRYSQAGWGLSGIVLGVPRDVSLIWGMNCTIEPKEMETILAWLAANKQPLQE